MNKLQTICAAVVAGALLLGSSGIALAARTAVPTASATNANGILYNSGGVVSNSSTYTFDGANEVNSASNATLNMGGAALYTQTGFQVSSSTNNFFQTVVQNLSSGNNASADMVLNNASSTNSTYYGEIGINGPSYSQAGFTGESGQDLFLLSSDANLDIETASSTGPNAIKFLTGGTMATNVHGIVQGNGNTAFGSSTPMASFQSTATSTNATTTVELGKTGQTRGTCIKMYTSNGTAVYLSATTTAQALYVSTTACGTGSYSGF